MTSASLIRMPTKLGADVHEDVVVAPRGRGVRLLVMVWLQLPYLLRGLL